MYTRHVLTAAALVLLAVPACVAAPESGDDVDGDPDSQESEGSEDVGEATAPLTIVTTTRGSVPNINCDVNTSTVSLSIGANYTSDTLAPWKNLAAGGTFSLGSGANGVQIRYWIDTDNTLTQTDGVATSAAAGNWSWTRTGFTCAPHTFTVCAIPYVNGNACGDLTAPTSSGYRVCKSVSFRGCSSAIGVIPDYNTSCPAGTDSIARHMDDQDDTLFHDNNNASSGWIGKTVSNSNTDLAFCRVDGANFRSLTSCSTDTTRDYAVLKLGSVCPNGSVEFWKNIDNEDDDNDNSLTVSSGDFSPNVSGKNTGLHFCLFRHGASGSATMGLFPALGFAYGVFGPSSLMSAGAASSSGWFYTDDEDSNNANSYGVAAGAPSDTYTRAQKAVTAGGNTKFFAAKAVTSASQGTGATCATGYCGDGTCGANESSATCPSDCGYCGDGACGANETVSSCPSDCGYCGDGICAVNEDAVICPYDCGSCCTPQQAAKAEASGDLAPCLCVSQ